MIFSEFYCLFKKKITWRITVYNLWKRTNSIITLKPKKTQVVANMNHFLSAASFIRVLLEFSFRPRRRSEPNCAAVWVPVWETSVWTPDRSSRVTTGSSERLHHGSSYNYTMTHTHTHTHTHTRKTAGSCLWLRKNRKTFCVSGQVYVIFACVCVCVCACAYMCVCVCVRVRICVCVCASLSLKLNAVLITTVAVTTT